MERERDPEQVADASRGKSDGGRRVTVDELVEKSHTVIERVLPVVERAMERLRARFASKK